MKKLLVTSLLLSSASVFAAPFTVQDIRVEGTDPVTAENIEKYTKWQETKDLP